MKFDCKACGRMPDIESFPEHVAGRYLRRVGWRQDAEGLWLCHRCARGTGIGLLAEELDSKVLTVSEAAKRLGVSRQRIYRRLAAEQVNAVKVRGITFVARDDVDRLLRAAGSGKIATGST